MNKDHGQHCYKKLPIFQDPTSSLVSVGKAYPKARVPERWLSSSPPGYSHQLGEVFYRPDSWIDLYINEALR
jgi:hypothetical protein